ncbi:MAG: hypothetical protein A4E57_04216 [Syntrophorhabdaceae bacterium PtaU1.Bin034]|jgi:archaellum component FlaC|nr:MAG: hypothetical protein A4E57_04216 [Syntrophorhabdaceae bacterium PtaU1.Bin034]
MDGIKTVDGLLKAKALTPEEEDQLHDIIEECRTRERQIREASRVARQNLESLSRSFGMVMETIATVSKSIDDLHEEVEKLQLRMMPEDQFYRE